MGRRLRTQLPEFSLGKMQKPTQHTRSFIIVTEKGTLRKRFTLVKAELQSLSKVDKQTTFTSTASSLAVQDTEEITSPSKLQCTTTEAQMKPVPSQSAPSETRLGRIVKPPDRLNL